MAIKTYIYSTANSPMRIVLFLFLLLSKTCLFGQSLRNVKTIGKIQNQNVQTVFCIHQDQQGFVWIGTLSGLIRYDGHSYRKWKIGPEGTGLSNSYLLHIREFENKIFVGTARGINVINAQTNRTEHYYLDPKNPASQANMVSSINEFQNKLYASSPLGIYVYEKKGEKYQWKKCISGHILSFSEIKKNQLRVLFQNDRLEDYEIQNGQFVLLKKHDLKEQKSSVFVEALDENYSLLSNANGAEIIHHKTGQKRVLRDQNQQIISEFHFRRIKKIKDDFWILTSNAILRANKKDLLNGTATKYPIPLTSIEGAEFFNFMDFYFDQHNQLWVSGNLGIGIYEFNSHFSTFQSSSPKINQKIGNIIWNLQIFKDRLFVITNDEILSMSWSTYKAAQAANGHIFSPDDLNVISHLKFEKGNHVSFIQEIDKRLYATNLGGEILEWSESTKSFHKLQFDSKTKMALKQIVPVCFTYDENYIYLGGKLGLVLLHRKDFTLFQIHLNLPCSSLFYSKNKKCIYIGTNTLGLFSYDQKGKFTKLVDRVEAVDGARELGPIFCMAEDKDGSLWMASFGQGLLHYLPKSKQCEVFNERNGMINTLACGLLISGNSKIWVSTQLGLACFNKNTNRFTLFNQNDGLPHIDFNQNAYLKWRDWLFFGTIKGFTFFKDYEDRKQTQPLSPVITQLNINNQLENDLRLNEHGKSLILQPYERTFKMAISSREMVHQESLQYAYQMIGYDQDYIINNLGNNSVYYTNLPYGKYVLKVKVTNIKSGLKSFFSIPVELIAPFYRRPWVVCLEVFFAICLISFIFYFIYKRKLRIQRDKVLVQLKVFEERSRIARELHDNIGSNLSYIASSLEMSEMLFQRNKQELAKEKIENLGTFTQTTIQELRESIWVMSQSTISVDDFITRIRESVTRFFNNTELQIEFDTSGSEEVKLGSQISLHLIRIVQEACNNALKYAACTQLKVRINYRRPQLEIEISDNGIGFEMDEKMMGHGLNNMQHRAEMIHAKWTLNSQQGKGTCIKLKLNLSEENKPNG